MPEKDPQYAIRRLVELAAQLGDGYTGCCDPASDDAVKEANDLYSALGSLPPERLAGLGITGEGLTAAEAAYHAITGAQRPLRNREQHGLAAGDAIRAVFDEADSMNAHYAAGGYYMPGSAVVDGIRTVLSGLDEAGVQSLLPDGTSIEKFRVAYSMVVREDFPSQKHH